VFRHRYACFGGSRIFILERNQINILEREQPRDYAAEAYLKHYDDAATWVAEALDGAMRNDPEFSFNGHDYIGRDGRSMKEFIEKGVIDARRLSLSRPELTFEMRRRQHEADEFRELVAMGRGELPNTMVVVSDHPPELMYITKDLEGYRASRKQTWLRVLAIRPDGIMVMYNQSLDQSDRDGLEAMYGALGFEAEPGELLGQRMHLELDPDEQQYLINRLTGVYDRMLAAKYGGQWFAGRQDNDRINTLDYVNTQSDLIDAFARLKMMDSQAAEVFRYEFAAAMEKRFRERKLINPTRAIVRAVGNDIYREMYSAGQEARSAGKTFSGCGSTVRATGGATSGEGQTPSTEGDMKDAGYGNKEESKKLPATIRCINCKEKVPSKEVVKPKTWCCPKCKYEVDVCTGKVLCSGNKK
jgi:hypothetical protein